MGQSSNASAASCRRPVLLSGTQAPRHTLCRASFTSRFFLAYVGISIPPFVQRRCTPSCIFLHLKDSRPLACIARIQPSHRAEAIRSHLSPNCTQPRSPLALNSQQLTQSQFLTRFLFIRFTSHTASHRKVLYSFPRSVSISCNLLVGTRERAYTRCRRFGLRLCPHFAIRPFVLSPQFFPFLLVISVLVICMF